MRTSPGLLLVAGLAVAICLTGRATLTREAGREAEIPTEKLVNTIRLLNTERVNYRQEHGGFASRDELISFLRRRNELEGSPLNLENPAPYQVQVTTDPGATHYQITIQRRVDRADKSTWCRTAAFSNDVGLIYLGQVIDCPAAPH
jgi:hypothetical protein